MDIDPSVVVIDGNKLLERFSRKFSIDRGPLDFKKIWDIYPMTPEEVKMLKKPVLLKGKKLKKFIKSQAPEQGEIATFKDKWQLINQYEIPTDLNYVRFSLLVALNQLKEPETAINPALTASLIVLEPLASDPEFELIRKIMGPGYALAVKLINHYPELLFGKDVPVSTTANEDTPNTGDITTNSTIQKVQKPCENNTKISQEETPKANGQESINETCKEEAQSVRGQGFNPDNLALTSKMIFGVLIIDWMAACYEKKFAGSFVDFLENSQLKLSGQCFNAVLRNFPELGANETPEEKLRFKEIFEFCRENKHLVNLPEKLQTPIITKTLEELLADLMNLPEKKVNKKTYPKKKK